MAAVFIKEDDIVSHEVIYSQEHEVYHIYQMLRVSSSLCERHSLPLAMGVYIDGACRRNGGWNPMASYGVVFRPPARASTTAA